MKNLFLKLLIKIQHCNTKFKRRNFIQKPLRFLPKVIDQLAVPSISSLPTQAVNIHFQQNITPHLKFHSKI